MSRPVRLSFAARIDFLEAVEWYEFRQNGLGERFGIAIDAAFERIIRNPELFRSTIYRVRGNKVRRLVVSRFPFVVYFYAGDEEIVIVAIFHTARDPREISTRTGQ